MKIMGWDCPKLFLSLYTCKFGLIKLKDHLNVTDLSTFMKA